MPMATRTISAYDFSVVIPSPKRYNCYQIKASMTTCKKYRILILFNILGSSLSYTKILNSFDVIVIFFFAVLIAFAWRTNPFIRILATIKETIILSNLSATLFAISSPNEPQPIAGSSSVFSHSKVMNRAIFIFRKNLLNLKCLGLMRPKLFLKLARNDRCLNVFTKYVNIDTFLSVYFLSSSLRYQSYAEVCLFFF